MPKSKYLYVKYCWDISVLDVNAYSFNLKPYNIIIRNKIYSIWISDVYVRLTKSKIWMVTSNVTYFSYSKFIWNGCCPTHTKFPTPYITLYQSCLRGSFVPSNLRCVKYGLQQVAYFIIYIWNMINWLLNLKWNLSVSLKFIAVLSISTFYSTREWWWSLHDQLFVVYRTHIFSSKILIRSMQEDI